MTKKISLVVLGLQIICLVFISGCAALKPVYYSLQTNQDVVEGSTTYSAWENGLGHGDRCSQCGSLIDGGDGSPCYFKLGLEKFVPKSGNPEYLFIVQYEGPDWIFIEPGESLVLLADGKRIGFIGEGSSNQRKILSGYKNTAVEELAFYPVKLKTLKKIANSSSVILKVVCQSSNYQRCFTTANFSFLKSFISETAGQKNQPSL